MQNLRDKLASEVIACKWHDIVSFLPKAEILILGSELDIVETALAFAEDRVNDVEVWLANGLLQKIDPNAPEDFPDYADTFDFQLIVVTPFALAKPVGHKA